MSKIIEIPVQTHKQLRLFKTAVPKLTNARLKGQNGRIGIIGGCLEYTGAPYFAALSALKVGADLSHVFCHRDAATVIKCYSPDLFVHPVLDRDDAVDHIKQWLYRLHVIVIGPGLGRDPVLIETARKIMILCLSAKKPTVIDADGLHILNNNFDIICGQRNVILTPNAMEFRRLFGDNAVAVRKSMNQLGNGVVVFEKGASDKIHIPHTSEIYIMPEGGTGRRCGGQGDILSGSLATFFYWCLHSNQSNPAFLASCATSHLVKLCNAAAFEKYGRGMVTSDMINEIPSVFKTGFENTKAD